MAKKLKDLKEENKKKNIENKEVDFNKEVFGVLAGKSSDLTWFMFESRIRQLVLDLCEPIQEKS